MRGTSGPMGASRAKVSASTAKPAAVVAWLGVGVGGRVRGRVRDRFRVRVRVRVRGEV